MKVLKPSHQATTREVLQHSLGLSLGTCRAHQHYRVSPSQRALLISPLELTRIFHTDSAAACEHLMDTVSASNCSSGNTSARLALSGLPKGSLHRGLLGRRWCLDQDSRRLATNQYEICELKTSSYLFTLSIANEMSLLQTKFGHLFFSRRSASWLDTSGISLLYLL